MRSLRRILVALFYLAVIIVLVLWLKPPQLLRVGANYAAKTVCSNVFLAGRDTAEVLRSDVQAPGIWILRLMRVSVDRQHGVVRAGFLGFIGDGLAVSRGGAGCSVVADGKLEHLAALPESARTRAAPATVTAPLTPRSPAMSNAAAARAGDAALWPDGDTVATLPSLQRLLADDALTGPGMRAVLVIDHGRIVAERYAAGFTPDTPLQGWSMAKTVTAGLVGLLVRDGKLKLDQMGFWPQGDGRDHIRLADLLAMSSGLRFNEEYGAVSDVTRMLFLEPDTAGFAHAQPLVHPVGERWSYSSGTANIVARIVQDAAGVSTDVQDLLFAPLGMRSAVIERDESGTLVGSSYMYATARDWARYALLLLQNGAWQGRQMLPQGFVDMMAEPVPASRGQYGRGFVWLWASDPLVEGQNPDTAFGIPADTFYLSGHDGQIIAVMRSHQIAVVRLGLTPYSDHYAPQRLLQAVLDAAS
jgi:CubicO group peptidase (beta-lactamase class C family)